jgi:mono/diheme cytochrome c family protein
MKTLKQRPVWPGSSRLCVYLALALLAWLGPASAQPGPPTPEQIDDGRMVYDDLCAMCHGRDMVNPGIASFDLRQFPKEDFARFQNSVLNGKGTSMPAWRGQISDDDLTVLWAYVRGGP